MDKIYHKPLSGGADHAKTWPGWQFRAPKFRQGAEKQNASQTRDDF